MRWPRLRFSVRTLMVLTLFVACGLACVAQRVRHRREFAQAFRRSAGGLVYDWQLPNGRYNSAAKPPWPDRIVALLGPDFFGDVRWANIGPLGNDATMEFVGQPPAAWRP